jgi:hypothetical protein
MSNQVIGPYTTEIQFSWGDAPTKIYAAAAGKLIYSVRLVITSGFDGADPVVSVGDANDHSRLLSSGIMDITETGVNEVFPQYVYETKTDVYVYVTPGMGGSKGAGRIVITHQN